MGQPQRSETSRRKIQSRFSVFTTSSQTEDVASVTNSWSIHPKRNPAPSVNPGTEQLWQTNCDISANGGTPETERCSAKRSTSETKSDGPPQQQNADSNQTTIWHHQPLTLAKWFEPLQAHHLTSLISEHSALKRDPPQKPKSDGSQQGHSLPKTRTKPNNQWVWWKHQCCFNNKRLTASNMLLQKRDPPQKRKSDGSQPLNASIKVWQQHHNGSIWCTDIQTKCCSAPRSTSKTKFDGSQQKQLTAPTNHLKEEPSAPQSLSIFW